MNTFTTEFNRILIQCLLWFRDIPPKAFVLKVVCETAAKWKNLRRWGWGEKLGLSLGALVLSLVHLLAVIHSYHRSGTTEPTIFRTSEPMGQDEFSSSGVVWSQGWENWHANDGGSWEKSFRLHRVLGTKLVFWAWQAWLGRLALPTVVLP